MEKRYTIKHIINLTHKKMTEEYILEEDYPLMESINHYARLANKEDYKYKFIEIMKRIEHDDVVFLGLLDVMQQAFFVDGQIDLAHSSFVPPVLLLSKYE